MAKQTFSEKLYIIRRRLKAVICSVPYYICRVFSIQKNKIVFSAFEGMGYCCNPKYIAEELLRRQAEDGKSYEMVWLVNDVSKTFPSGVRPVRNTLWNRAYHLSTAGIWVDNARKNYGTRKRKNQYYILTWHGPVGFKPVGRLRGESFSRIAEIVSRYDAKMVDVLLSNSQWCNNIWENAFWNEPVRILGSPRCDILFNERQQCYDRVRREYALPEEARIVIYAPTFRGGSQEQKREVFQEKIALDFHGMIRALEKRFGGVWYIFMRFHPQLVLRMRNSRMEADERMIDISFRDDLYEVLAGADAFVSDYSSAAFDAAYMRIPVFLYADDIDDYIHDRGKLTWKLQDIPFPMAGNNKDLQTCIEEFDNKMYLEKLERTFDGMGLLEDGNASRRVADLIDAVIGNKK